MKGNLPMTKDEKILKKVGKLLSIYGVSDEEKKKFLADVQDTKNDEEEPIEDGEEEKVEETEETEPTEKGEELTESGEVEEKGETEEPIEPQEKVAETEENEVEDKQEEVVKEDEKLVEEPVVNEEPKVEETEEVKKTIEGLVARISSLEELVSKLAIPEEKDFGTSPANQSAESYKETELERYNKMRTGR